jgi:hypothetical protein
MTPHVYAVTVYGEMYGPMVLCVIAVNMMLGKFGPQEALLYTRESERAVRTMASWSSPDDNLK